MSLKQDILHTAVLAQKAARFLGALSSEKKNKAIKAMADSLLNNSQAIIKANKKDIKFANEQKRSSAFIDRLTLSSQRIKKMSNDLLAVIALEDPVGKVIKIWRRPNGLNMCKISVPLGVIGIIYESRPNVTSDCAALCLKAGNAVILRGGKESIHSNIAIYKAIFKALTKCGFPEGCISLICTTDRAAVSIMLSLSDHIDLIIPRGGESLIRSVVENSKIPVIKHYKGICHTYIDKYADLNMAEEIAFNAKVQRPSTCNAMECLLVHKSVAAEFLPRIVKRLKKAKVEIRGCQNTIKLVKGVKKATNKDYATEFLDLILAIKIVNSMAEALAHIVKYGSKHSDAIITDNFPNGMKFLKLVDSACVYLNASTRFTDGNEFGLGAEIGVSTDKLHARGPMGLEELTIYKYMVMGNGQIRK
ncbi:MAG: glutamate-5-semialdehyde dehydrogenase [Candidatus Omnitrophica bacterium]|nr:glutamate-5-semialdehyde dehydrogenase [Candidatus Omnitrophota bacterium]